jgi:hypothetical protein
MSEERFDPTAPEGDAAVSNQYVTKKDIKYVGIFLVVLAAILFPIFRMMKANSEKALCASNLGQVYKALNQYAEQHDDRLPPLFHADEAGAPAINAQGLPYTWVSDLYEYMSKRASFICPTASDEQNAQQEHPESSKMKLGSSFGLYAPYATFPRSSIENPGDTIIVGETANHGSNGTSNPKPYSDASGKEVLFDGFVIAWDNSNTSPNEKTKYVSRLAFPNSKDGFKEDGSSRHGPGINVLTADGKRRLMKPNEAEVKMRDGIPTGFWRVPPVSAKK